MQLGIALALPLVAFSLLLGQVVMLVGATLALAWWCLRRGSPVLAGIILSLVAVKPQLAFLVPLGLLAGLHVRAVVAWASASAALALVTVAAVGTGGVAPYRPPPPEGARGPPPPPAPPQPDPPGPPRPRGAPPTAPNSGGLRRA